MIGLHLTMRIRSKRRMKGGSIVGIDNVVFLALGTFAVMLILVGFIRIRRAKGRVCDDCKRLTIHCICKKY